MESGFTVSKMILKKMVWYWWLHKNLHKIFLFPIPIQSNSFILPVLSQPYRSKSWFLSGSKYDLRCSVSDPSSGSCELYSRGVFVKTFANHQSRNKYKFSIALPKLNADEAN
jgi:hypothetical protein